MNDPLISVIVPIYNVEKYVRKCLDSLKNQTMKQIEVICIDDGSTDSSGNIAEEYKSRNWPQFRVIHTENHGLSAARNRGLDEALADWIMFVDSDDWVDERFCEIPYKVAVEANADMVIFGNDSWKGKKQKNKDTAASPAAIIDEFTAHEYGGIATWRRLSKKDLFEGIRFPEGRLYEDSGTVHKYVHKAKKIVRINDCLYHYELRKDSITHTIAQQNRKDCFISTLERYNELIAYGYPEEKTKLPLLKTAIAYLSVTQPCSDELYIKASNIVDSIEGIPQSLSYKKKIALVAWRTDKSLFLFLSRCTGRLRTIH